VLHVHDLPDLFELIAAAFVLAGAVCLASIWLFYHLPYSLQDSLASLSRTVGQKLGLVRHSAWYGEAEVTNQMTTTVGVTIGEVATCAAKPAPDTQVPAEATCELARGHTGYHRATLSIRDRTSSENVAEWLDT
jgi:hypothetical protein